MSCLYFAVSQRCKSAHGAAALKVGFSSPGKEVRERWLQREGYGGFTDWRIKNCEWFRWEKLNAEQLESLERGVFGWLTKAGSRHPCPGADEIIIANEGDVIAAFQWAKRRVRAGTWDFGRAKMAA